MIKKLSCLSAEMKNVLKTLLAASLFVILASCGNGEGEWESGGGYNDGSREAQQEKAFIGLQISLKENSQRKISAGERENLAKIDCAASGIEKISVRISRAGAKDLDFGPFDCSLGEATISNGLTPGVVTLTLEGLNPSEKMIYKGVGNDLTLNPGYNPVIIQMAPLTGVVNNTPAAITAFSLGGVQGVIDEASKSISVTLPAGTYITALLATFSSTGKIVDVGGSIQASGTTSNNFSTPIVYTVTAEDDTKTSYTVTVTVAPVSDKAITAFSLGGVQGVINETTKNISVTMPNGTDITNLAALFTTTGGSVSLGGVVQNNGVTLNDFTTPLTYLVTATDGTTASYTVTVRVALKSEKAITSFSFSDLTCVIDETTKSISVTMPYGTVISALVATFTTTGESVLKGGIVQKSGQTVNNFTNPVTYRVTAADKTKADYTVTVAVAPNSAKAITSFSLSGATGVIDEAKKSIAVTVPFGADIKRLVATYTTTGKSVDVEGALQSNGQTPNDFTNPVTYRVTAVDETTVDYTVTVSVALNSEKAITSFSVSGVSGVIDEGAKSISVTVPYGPDITNLTATFTATGESVSKGGVVQTSGVTQNDFTNPLIYRVTAADGTTASYTVSVTVLLNPAKAITAFSVFGVSGVIDEGAKSILVTMPFAVNLTALAPAFSTTGDKVAVSGAAQSSGQTSNDFTNPLVYRVTAENGTTADYTVTVLLSSEKAITSFSVSGVSGVIDQPTRSITVTMPFPTDITALAPAFITTGEKVEVSGVKQSSGQTSNNFTNPLIYRVTAADASTLDYTVTVTVALNPAKAITSFSVSGVSGVIDQPTRSITVTMPFPTDITALASVFVTTGEKVEVSGVKQSSGQTSNNFTNPLIYRVTAADGSTLDYTVTVTVALNPAKAITSYSISGVSGTIDEAAKSIRVLLPRGTAVDGAALVATFTTTTGAGVKVGTASQASGVTANDFAGSVIYTVTATDSATATYKVTVTALFKLPDTGQTTSYTTTFGEDHDYTINPPAYTNNGDGTVTDNVTGLMWQQGGDGLTYNWFQASGTADSTSNPGGAKDVCGSLTTGGHQDWRLPERLELASIVDRGVFNPSINSSYFPGTKASWYWSSTTYAYNSAWCVYFYDGYDSYSNKASNYYVRCVRGGQ